MKNKQKERIKEKKEREQEKERSLFICSMQGKFEHDQQYMDKY